MILYYKITCIPCTKEIKKDLDELTHYFQTQNCVLIAYFFCVLNALSFISFSYGNFYFLHVHLYTCRIENGLMRMIVCAVLLRDSYNCNHKQSKS